VRTRALLPIALAVVSDACAPSAPATAKGPLPPAASSKASVAPPPARPPVASPGRWIGPTYEPAFSRAIGGTTLYFGADGARWAGFPRPADPVEIGLAPEPIAAAFANGPALVMVGASSTAYVAKSLLGPVVERRAPTLGGPVFPAKSAAFMIAGGALLRFADPSVGWVATPLPLGGRVVTQVVASPEGLVLALASPQALFASGDDGAHFTPIAAPLAISGISLRAAGITVDGVERRAAGLAGAPTQTASYVLTGDPPHLETAGWSYAPTRGNARAQASTGLAHAAAGERGGFLDDRWLELQPSAGAANLLARPIDGTRTPSLVNVLARCDAPILATRAPRTLALACHDEHRARLLRSEDGGARFEEVASFEGRVTALAIEARALLLARCEATEACAPRLARARGGALTDLTIAPGAEDFEPVGRLVALDGDGDGRAIAIGFARRSVALGEIEPTGLVRRALIPWADARRMEAVRLGVEAGALRTIVARASGGWLLFRRTDAGFAPSPLPIGAESVAVAGARALAWNGRRVAWESNDGGATWTALDAPPLGEGVCGTHGCVFDALTTRIGWSLPGAAPRLAPPSRVRTPHHARGLRCHATGAATSLGRSNGALDVDATVDLEGGVRFARPVRDDARALHVAFARGATLTKTKLLDGATSTAASWLGVAAARLDRDPKGGKLQAALAWWSPRGGVGTAVVPTPYYYMAVGPTTKGAYVFEGGRLRLFPTSGAPRELSFAGSASAIGWVDADPKSPRVLATDGRYALAFDGTPPAPPKVGDPAPSPVDAIGLLGVWPAGSGLPVGRVRTLGGDPRAAFALVSAGNDAVPAATFLLARPGDDPSAASFVRAPTALELADPKRACAANATGLRVTLPPTRGARRAIQITTDPGAPELVLPSGESIARLDGAGGGCLATIVADGAGVQAIVPLADLAHAWLLRDERRLVSARPLTCAWSDEPLPASLRDADGFYDEAWALPAP
jgi:hypothetical protein